MNEVPVWTRGRRALYMLVKQEKWKSVSCHLDFDPLAWCSLFSPLHESPWRFQQGLWWASGGGTSCSRSETFFKNKQKKKKIKQRRDNCVTPSITTIIKIIMIIKKMTILVLMLYIDTFTLWCVITVQWLSCCPHLLKEPVCAVVFYFILK